MYVELQGICKKFGDFTASDNINIGIEKGSLVALLGPSGSGKTTILRMIAGLETPDKGDIYINGKRINDIEPSKRGIGFVFQNYALFRYMNVYDNIAFGLTVLNQSKHIIRKRVDELIELTGLAGLEKRYPNELSGGQRQRVAFARAIAPNPELLLLDEPFAAIDARVRNELRTWLRNMIYQVGITSIFVTHGQDEAVEVADKIIVTNHGRVEQTGMPVTIYKNPATPFVSEFIGQSAVIENYHRLRGFNKGDYLGAVVRPEFIEAFKPDNKRFKSVIPASEEGIIRDIVFRGNHLELTLDVNGVMLTTHRSLERRDVSVGEKMRVIVYKVLAYDEKNTCLIENQELKALNVDYSTLESYLYNVEQGSFIV